MLTDIIYVQNETGLGGYLIELSLVIVGTMLGVLGAVILYNIQFKGQKRNTQIEKVREFRLNSLHKVYTDLMMYYSKGEAFDILNEDGSFNKKDFLVADNKLIALIRILNCMSSESKYQIEDQNRENFNKALKIFENGNAPSRDANKFNEGVILFLSYKAMIFRDLSKIIEEEIQTILNYSDL